MHKYRELNESIHVPVGLDQRVLAAAREQEKSRRRGGALRIAVCAACALALVAGGFRLRPGETAPSITYEFGLTVSAADMTQGANGGIIFRWMENCGHFRVTGTGIKSITLATDRGELWRAGESLGSSVTEDFDPAAIYGLAPKAGEGLDSLDGATLTLTAADENGQEQTETYHLTAETIRTFVNENGEEVLVPALAGDDQAAEPALYAADADSRWLTWPVAGSNTVSLSNRYGYRWNPAGETRTAGDPRRHRIPRRHRHPR